MKQKLHLIIDEKCFRDILHYALLTKEEIVVTDAHALVIHKTSVIFSPDFVDSIPDGRWIITKAVLQKMNAKGATYVINNGNMEITVKGQKAIYPILSEEHFAYERFPKYRDVIPNEYKGELNLIGLNPTFLDNIRQAIDPDNKSVAIQFSDDTHAFKVTVIGTDVTDYTAILMPCLINE